MSDLPRRLVITFETEAGCAERLRASGYAGDVADEIALYLAQAGDLAAAAGPIGDALRRVGIETVFQPLDDPVPLLRVLADDPARTMLWCVTDGFAWYRGSFAVSAARLLGCRTFGSSPEAQHLCQDKFACGAIAHSLGIRVPPTVLANGSRLLGDSSVLPPQGPYFVKPNTLGAKIGIAADSRAATLDEALRIAARIQERYGDRAVIQPYVEGFDVRVSFMATAPGDVPPARLGIDRVNATSGGEAGGAFLTLQDSLTLSRLADAGDTAQLSVTLGDLESEDSAASRRACAEIGELVPKLASAIGLADYFSFDVRVTPEGKAHFLEFEVCPAVTIYDFRAYLHRKHRMDLTEALAWAVPLSWARQGGMRG